MDRAASCKIERIVEEGKDYKTFFFDFPERPEPGQYWMLWLPGTDEKPFSASYKNGITVKQVGPFTRELFKKKEGEFIWLRGPYGNGFSVKGKKPLLVGGGCGIAPLAYLSEFFKRPTIIQGAKTSKEILFRKRLMQIICTNDGSEGYHGFPTEKMEEVVEKKRFDQIYTCGPEVMMKKVCEIGERHNIPAQVSLERYIKCSRGICGSCIIGPGLRVCKDGPVFNYKKLRNTEFGKFKRDKAGSKCLI